MSETREEVFRRLRAEPIRHEDAMRSSESLRRWASDDPLRPEGGCYDCRAPYRSWPDVMIPDEWWLLISPRLDASGEPGFGGLLCPTCIHRRLVAIGFEGVVPAAIASGPLMQPDRLGDCQIEGERPGTVSDTMGGASTESIARGLEATP